MPFDVKKFNSTPTAGEVGQPFLSLIRGMLHLESALRQIAKKLDIDISEDLAEIERARREIDEAFDSLTGYTKS